MKTDPQHLLPEHVPFYKKKRFWYIVLLGITVIGPIYVSILHTTNLELVLTANISLPTFTLGAIFNSGSLGLSMSLVMYLVLLFFSLFRKRINFYTLGILIILMLWSLYFTIDFIENFV